MNWKRFSDEAPPPGAVVLVAFPYGYGAADHEYAVGTVRHTTDRVLFDEEPFGEKSFYELRGGYWCEITPPGGGE